MHRRFTLFSALIAGAFGAVAALPLVSACQRRTTDSSILAADAQAAAASPPTTAETVKQVGPMPSLAPLVKQLRPVVVNQAPPGPGFAADAPGPSAGPAAAAGRGQWWRRGRFPGSDGAFLPLLRAADAERAGAPRAGLRLPDRRRAGPHQQPRGRDPGRIAARALPADGRDQGDHRRDRARWRARVRREGDRQ